MELSVIGRRIKHRRRKVVVEKIHKTNSVKDCAYTVSHDSGGKPLLLLSAEVFSDVSNSTYSVNFRLTQTTITHWLCSLSIECTVGMPPVPP